MATAGHCIQQVLKKLVMVINRVECEICSSSFSAAGHLYYVNRMILCFADEKNPFVNASLYL